MRATKKKDKKAGRPAVAGPLDFSGLVLRATAKCMLSPAGMEHMLVIRRAIEDSGTVQAVETGDLSVGVALLGAFLAGALSAVSGR